ncbi:MAG TPA: hypothetical protein VK003_07295 [Oceanobacillus sp.]|nr:hypothetical protein [Oceanobacillus sp.]
MDTEMIGQQEDTLIRGYVETMLILALSHGKPDNTRIDLLVKRALRHPQMRHLTYEELYRIVRHCLLVMDMEDFDEQLRSLDTLLTTEEERYTALDVALSAVMVSGKLDMREKRRLLDLQLFFGLTDEEIEDIISRYHIST